MSPQDGVTPPDAPDAPRDLLERLELLARSWIECACYSREIVPNAHLSDTAVFENCARELREALGGVSFRGARMIGIVGWVRVLWHCGWRFHRPAKIGGVYGPAWHWCASCGYGKSALPETLLGLVNRYEALRPGEPQP